MRGSWLYRTPKGHYSSITTAWMNGEVNKIIRSSNPVIYFEDPADAVVDLGRWDDRFRVGRYRADSYAEMENFVSGEEISLKALEVVDSECDYAEVLSFLQIAWPMITLFSDACTMWIKDRNAYLFPLNEEQTYLVVEVLPKEEVKS